MIPLALKLVQNVLITFAARKLMNFLKEITSDRNGKLTSHFFNGLSITENTIYPQERPYQHILYVLVSQILGQFSVMVKYSLLWYE